VTLIKNEIVDLRQVKVRDESARPDRREKVAGVSPHSTFPAPFSGVLKGQAGPK